MSSSAAMSSQPSAYPQQQRTTPQRQEVPKPTAEPEPLGEPQCLLTDPDQAIDVAFDTGVKDNRPVTHRTTYAKFFEQLSMPDPHRQTKEGPGFLNGPCHGLRRKANVPYYEFAVLDGDASVDEKGNNTPGAPSPLAVHTTLKEWNISHHIVTTFSHLSADKGNRWRLLLPVRITSPAQLRAVITYIVELLRVNADLPVYLTPESVVYGNRWHSPRTSHVEAPFYAATHFGFSLDPVYLARYYHQVGPDGQEVREAIPTQSKFQSTGIIAQFCGLFPLPDMLTANGYKFSSQGVVTDQHGREQPMMRFLKPGSDNGAGVVVFWDVESARWRGYSHHANDVMATGHSFDSFDVLERLGGEEQGTNYIELAAAQIRLAMVEYMSKKHPILLEGGKFRVGYLMDQEHGKGQEYRFLRWEDFQNKMASQPGIFESFMGKEGEPVMKVVDLAAWWKTHKDRCDYDGVTFRPVRLGEDPERAVAVGGTRYFNLFNGWPLRPEAGRCDLIDWHLREVICGGREAEYEYLMDWLAHMLQFPAEKPGVALVLRSGKGTGKSMVMSSLCHALGPLGIVIANNRQLTGDFNSHMRNKVFALVEESFWAGSHSDEGPLKHLITDEKTTFERKGIDAEPGMSFVRLVLITNSVWAAPASSDERRFFFLSVGDAGKRRNQQDGRYFTDLLRELNGGGINVLAHRLMQRRISKEAVRHPPLTEGLARQKLLSLNGLQAWAYDAVKIGAFRNPRGDAFEHLREYPNDSVIKVDFLVESAKAYLTTHDNSRSIQTRIEVTLTEMFGPPKTEVIGNAMVYRLPSIQTLRSSFDEFIGSPTSWS